MRKRAEAEIADPGIRQKVIASLKHAKDSMMKVIKRGQLKKGKRFDKSNVNDANVVAGKRSRIENRDRSTNNDGIDKSLLNKKMKRLSKSIGIKVGDIITADSKLFDGDSPGSYSSENPELQIGSIVKTWKSKGVAQVKWLDGRNRIRRWKT
jgi:hypothetical protein